MASATNRGKTQSEGRTNSRLNQVARCHGWRRCEAGGGISGRGLNVEENKKLTLRRGRGPWTKAEVGVVRTREAVSGDKGGPGPEARIKPKTDRKEKEKELGDTKWQRETGG